MLRPSRTCPPATAVSPDMTEPRMAARFAPCRSIAGDAAVGGFTCSLVRQVWFAGRAIGAPTPPLACTSGAGPLMGLLAKTKRLC